MNIDILSDCLKWLELTFDFIEMFRKIFRCIHCRLLLKACSMPIAFGILTVFSTHLAFQWFAYQCLAFYWFNHKWNSSQCPVKDNLMMKLYLDYPKHRINLKHLEHDRNSIECNFLNASKHKQNITNSECFKYSKYLQSTDSNRFHHICLWLLYVFTKTTFLTDRIPKIKRVSKISTKTYYQLETFTAYYISICMR